jgi:hypothetical protein
MKVIACTLDNENYKYLALDANSGGYPYWTDHFKSAEMYSDSSRDQERMNRELDCVQNDPDSKYSDGTIYPNVMKHSALDLSNKKLSGSGWLVVLQIKLEQQSATAIEGAIKAPKGYTY